jgi:hypothetical protein
LREEHHHVFTPHELEDTFGDESCAYTERRVAENKISIPGFNKCVVMGILRPIWLIGARVKEITLVDHCTAMDSIEDLLRSLSLI